METKKAVYVCDNSSDKPMPQRRIDERIVK